MATQWNITQENSKLEPMYTVQQLVKLWASTESSLRKEMDKGTLKYVKIGGGRRIPESAALNFIKNATVKEKVNG